MRRGRLDEYGRELLDSRPMAIPAGFRRPETLQEQVQRLVRNEISRRAAEQGFETFEDADDFDVDDDMADPETPYEEIFDPVLGKGLTPQEFHDNMERYRKEYLDAQERYYRSLEVEEKLHGREDSVARNASKGGNEEGATGKVAEGNGC